MRVLVIDIGGTHVKILTTGKKEHRQVESGPTMTAQQMVAGVKQLAAGWKYDVELGRKVLHRSDYHDAADSQ
jgi:polyphosphate glucokinase